MKSYSWHQSALEALLSKPNAHHAWMLHAERNSGAEAFVDDLSLGLLCSEPNVKGLACEQCATCHAILHQSVHPDLLVLEPLEAEEEGEEKVLKRRQIKVEAARRALDFVSLSANSARGKIVVIKPADALNIEAANALLKILEEPPSNTRWLLLTHEPLRLPATIRSRCLLIKVPSSSASEALDYLTETQTPEAEFLLARSGGSPFAALAYQEVANEAEAFLAQLADPRKLSAVALGEQMAALGRAEQRRRLEIYLQVLSHLLIDCALRQAQLPARYHPEFPLPLEQVLSQVSPLALLNLYRDTRFALAGLEHPLQARLVLEGLLLNYKQTLTLQPLRKRATNE